MEPPPGINLVFTKKKQKPKHYLLNIFSRQLGKPSPGVFFPDNWILASLKWITNIVESVEKVSKESLVHA